MSLWKEGFEGPLTAEEAEVVRVHEELHFVVRERAMYLKGKCWIGTTTESPPKWDVSNGPAGNRGHATTWGSPREAIDYARKLGLAVVFEEDFRWD